MTEQRSFEIDVIAEEDVDPIKMQDVVESLISELEQMDGVHSVESQQVDRRFETSLSAEMLEHVTDVDLDHIIMAGVSAREVTKE